MAAPEYIQDVNICKTRKYMWEWVFIFYFCWRAGGEVGGWTLSCTARDGHQLVLQQTSKKFPRCERDECLDLDSHYHDTSSGSVILS